MSATWLVRATCTVWAMFRVDDVRLLGVVPAREGTARRYKCSASRRQHRIAVATRDLAAVLKLARDEIIDRVVYPCMTLALTGRRRRRAHPTNHSTVLAPLLAPPTTCRIDSPRRDLVLGWGAACYSALWRLSR